MWGGGVVRWWNGEVVEWWGGGVVKWWSGEMLEWWGGGVVEWWRGGVVKWWSGEVVEWWGIGVVRSWSGEMVECERFIGLQSLFNQCIEWHSLVRCLLKPDLFMTSVGSGGFYVMISDPCFLKFIFDIGTSNSKVFFKFPIKKCALGYNKSFKYFLINI